jgi:uncharacterized protein YcbK (DUF882 family)
VGAAPPRFFVEGDGRLAITNAHTDVRARVRYRRADGSYDADALAELRRAFRSKGDGGEGRLSLRLVEVLSRLQAMAGGAPLVVLSGYRSADYNEGLRRRGARAAAGSLHTEGLAADIALPRPGLRDLWLGLRGLDCCGVGYYQREGFLHVDVGRPRFWEPATSRVEENLSAGNARVFARTDYDRYAAGEPMVVALHALTVPPIRVAATAHLGAAVVALVGEGPVADGCLEVTASGATLRVLAVPAGSRARLVLDTCPPRPERTPDAIEANEVVVEGNAAAAR